MFSFFKRWQRNRILSKQISNEEVDVLSRNVWQYYGLNAEQKSIVHDCVRIMSAERIWEGTDGFSITTEIKTTIAGAASLLLLGQPQPYYFDRVPTIIVQPRTIQNRLIQPGMIVDPDNEFFSGQAWQNGPIVLAWPAVIAGTRESGNGRNVVIHEFAHHIDGLDGEMGGSPFIASKDLKSKWDFVFKRDFAQLVEDIRYRVPTKIDRYAGTNMAEFFAVSTEIFFDSPRFLRQQLPDVYDCLKEFFKIDSSQFDRF